MARVPTTDAREETERQGITEHCEFDGCDRIGTHSHLETLPDEAWDALEPADDVGLTTYRMSSLGGDLSALVAGAMGYEGTMPGFLLKYLQEGRDAEDTIVAMFNEEFAKRDATYPELAQLAVDGVIAGYDPVKNEATGTGGPVVWLRVGTTSLVKGHADRIVRINPKSEKHPAFAVVEAKKFRPTLWKVWQNMLVTLDKPVDWTADPVLEKYAWQVSALHHATKLPVYFVVGEFNPDTTAIDKISASLVTDKNVPHSLAELKARVMKAKKHVDAGAVPMCDREDNECMYAAFDFCPGKKEKEAEDVDDTELGRLLALYHAYTVDMAKTEDQRYAETRRKVVKEDIDKHIANAGHKRTMDDESGLMRVWSPTGDEFEFEWVTYPVRARGATSANKINLKLIVEGVAVDGEVDA